MAKSYLHGGIFKLYGYNRTDDNTSGIINDFANAIEIGNIELLLPDVTYYTGFSETQNLYKNGYYQEKVAQNLDYRIKNWQLISVFYIGADTYTGKVPVQECINLFPYRYKFEDFGYTTLYITLDDINTVWSICVPSTNAFKEISFNKLTLKETGDAGISVIYFHVDGPTFSIYSGVVNGRFCFDRAYMSSIGSATGNNNFTLGGSLNSANYNSDFKSKLESNYIPTNDPYDKGGSSGTGGGTGTFDGTGDDVDFPSLPTLSAVETGFISLFNPTIGQMQNLCSYMWSDAFSLDSFKKIFADPMDAILGISIVPVDVPNGGSGQVTVGNIPTGVSMTKAGSQYVELDCGTLNINEYWGAYLDYDPYTKIELYLPYCGIHPLKTDDVMGKSIHVKYHVDILSGACCAYVKCGDSVLYSFSGQCSCSIPVTGNNFTSVINGAISIAGSIGTMVSTGGLSAPITMGKALKNGASLASNVVSMKPSVERSGSFGSMSGMLAIQTPYLIITLPRQCLPKYQNTFEGYPSYITSDISDLSGYTIFEEIYLSEMSCTDSEKNEIENLLKTGVII